MMRLGYTKTRIKAISKLKHEPNWMLKIRLEGYDFYESVDNPTYCKPFKIDLKHLNYYHKLNDISIDYDISNLSGYELQTGSECVFCKNNNDDIIFCDMDSALVKYPDLVKKYFSKLIKPNDNKYAALSYSLWSGGMFIYIPQNIKLKLPLKYCLNTNEHNFGQFEHSIVVIEDNSEVEIIEEVIDDCLVHAGVVEVFVGNNAKCCYKTYQNRNNNTYNFVTKRSEVLEKGNMEWLDYNLGSKLNMKYPSCILKGNNACGNIVSLAIANENQIHDIGCKMIHLGENTKSSITSKLVSINGECNYREYVNINKSAKNCYSKINCETLLLDDAKGDIISNNTCNNTSTIDNNTSILRETSFDDYKKKLIVDLIKNQIEDIKK